jgi:ATP-dependent Clp protease ATP-binding subunit ClpA
VKFLDQVDGQLAEKGVHLEVSEAAKLWFAEHGYDKAMGARPMSRIIQNTLKAPLANEILFGELKHGGIAYVDVIDGKVAIRCEPGPEKASDDDEDDDAKDRDKREKVDAPN